MKGLLLKDVYQIRKYCKSYLLLVVVFIAASFAYSDNLFFVFYPCMVSGMIPVSLLGFDESSKWSEYCGTLPYTRAQIVSAKYLIGIFVQLILLTLSGISQAVRMSISGTFQLNDYLLMMAMLVIISCVTSSISLPFMFKLGVEKGRIAYFAMIAFISGGSVIAVGVLEASLQVTIELNGLLLLLCLLAVAVYALSWYLSIVFYRKREVK